MKLFRSMLVMGLVATNAAVAQEPKEFDACRVFTSQDAEKVLGVIVTQDVVNSKAKVKVVLACNYTSTSGDARTLQVAGASFRFAHNDDEAKRSFSEARHGVRGKPMIVAGKDAFWIEKLGQLNVLKGNTWLTVSAGPVGMQGRDATPAIKLAEILLPKI